MAKIENEIEYDAICQRIEELLPMTDDDTPLTDPKLIELRILSELVIEYEDEHYPMRAKTSCRPIRSIP
jgi:HTH-type transcriptional regulator/antitoxin HigA